MKTKKLVGLLTVTLTCLMLQHLSFCQSSYVLGVNASIEKTLHYNPNFSAGISIEKQLCQKNGIEIVVDYRHFQNDFANEKLDFVFLKNFSISEEFLRFSILSNYYFKHFNIAFGPSADLLIGWKNKSQVTYPYLNYLDKKVYYGLFTKVSKTIDINKRISIEPQIRFNPVFSSFSLYSKYTQLNDRQYVGLGITTKYKF